jgi:hypothetical protein
MNGMYTADWELVAKTAVYRLYRLPPMDDGYKQPRVEFVAEGGDDWAAQLDCGRNGRARPTLHPQHPLA